jgi:hypothetical protein
MRRRLPKGAWLDEEGNVSVALQRVRWPLGRLMRLRHRYLTNPYQLFWYVRLGAWVGAAVPVGLLVAWKIAFLGPVAFETWLAVVGYRAARRMRNRPPPSGPWDEPDAGDREPRSPLPMSGSGAMALPEPAEETS